MSASQERQDIITFIRELPSPLKESVVDWLTPLYPIWSITEWKAEIPKRSAPDMPYLILSVMLPDGEHKKEFTYEELKKT